jgi:hypothetical protein
MSDHTKVPWVIEDMGPAAGFVILEAYRGECPKFIARCVEPDVAQLLWAAPDLLEACRKAAISLAHQGDPDAWLEATQSIFSAIAKATRKEEPCART